MKTILLLITLTIFTSSVCFAGSHSRRGYTRKNGTYVPPGRQTDPDGSKYNNWSTKGNTNPYTGKSGTVDPYKPRK